MIDDIRLWLCVFGRMKLAIQGGHRVSTLLIVDTGPWILISLSANQITVLFSGLEGSTNLTPPG